MKLYIIICDNVSRLSTADGFSPNGEPWATKKGDSVELGRERARRRRGKAVLERRGERGEGGRDECWTNVGKRQRGEERHAHSDNAYTRTVTHTHTRERERETETETKREGEKPETTFADNS